MAAGAQAYDIKSKGEAQSWRFVVRRAHPLKVVEFCGSLLEHNSKLLLCSFRCGRNMATICAIVDGHGYV
jgi:hypothetical protein